MNIASLQNAIQTIKATIYQTVTTTSYNKRLYANGLEAKNALIKSSGLIQLIHEVAKRDLHMELTQRGVTHTIHPPLGLTIPELDVWGFLKKKQDIVVLVEDRQDEPEIITEGPMAGQTDELGLEKTKTAIVVGVRSQLSSVDKNFDTLMERTFAETLNLRLRHPQLVMGEIYLLAVREYDEQAMKQNCIEWKTRFANIERFISIFLSMSGRSNSSDIKEFYKYERCALVLVDFSTEPSRIYLTLDNLKNDRIVNDSFSADYSKISPATFSRDLIDSYMRRHSINSL